MTMSTETDNLNSTPKHEEENFDTTGLLLAYLANWKWFAVSVVVCIIIAYFSIASKIPMYQVNASIYLSDDHNSGQNAFSINASDPMVALKNYIDETELEVMKSKNNVIKIVDSLNLAYSYYAKGRLRDIPLYENNAIIAKLDSTSLRSLRSPIKITVEAAADGKYDILAETSFNGVSEVKEFKNCDLPVDVELSQGTVTISRSPIIADFRGCEIIKIVNPRTAAARISSSLNIEFAKNSDKIIRVSVVTDVMKRGVDIIDALLDFYNRSIIEEKNRSAVQTEAFILDRLVMISGELTAP